MSVGLLHACSWSAVHARPFKTGRCCCDSHTCMRSVSVECEALACTACWRHWSSAMRHPLAMTSLHDKLVASAVAHYSERCAMQHRPCKRFLPRQRLTRVSRSICRM